MAIDILTTGAAGIAPGVRQSYDRVLLNMLVPELKHAQFFDTRPIPLHEGDTINFRLPSRILPITTPLVEGVTPNANTYSDTPVQIQVQQYGDYIAFSDKVTWLMIDPVVSQIVKRQGVQAGETVDVLSRDVMHVGANVMYPLAGGHASRITVNNTDKITAADIKRWNKLLQKNFSKGRMGAAYVAIISPDTEADIMGLPEWLQAKQYSDVADLYRGYVGTLYNIHFVTSPLAKIFVGAGAAGVDVQSTVIFGQDAFLATEVSGHSIETISQPLGSGGTADPLNQRSTQGWKTTWGGKIANDYNVLRFESYATP